MMQPRIFISAVTSEFGETRQLVAAVFERLGYTPVRQDIFGTEPGDLREMLRTQIDGCDGVLHLVGFGYGAEPVAPDEIFGRVSYTQYEFLYARSRGKKTWIVFADDSYPGDHPRTELDLPPAGVKVANPKAWQAERRELQLAWRTRMQGSAHLRHPVATKEGLELKIERMKDDFGTLRRSFRTWQQVVLTSLVLLLFGALCVAFLLNRIQFELTALRQDRPTTMGREREDPAANVSPANPPFSTNKGIASTSTTTHNERTKPLLLLAPFAAVQAKEGQEAWAKHLGQKVVEKNTVGMELTLIPPGEFWMGSSDEDIGDTLAFEDGADFKRKSGWFADEQPKHRVRLTKPFRMGTHEVTQAEYERVMGSNPSVFSAGRNIGGIDLEGLNCQLFPVENVTWYDAVDFCNQLSRREGLTSYYSLTNITRGAEGISEADLMIVGGNGYRLPTEAEWEYACRAGTSTQFHFGYINDGTKANINGSQPFGSSMAGPDLGRPTFVGSYDANEFGLCDMCGNVLEWCEDWYDAKFYEQSKTIAIDPICVSASGERVLRGGSWDIRGLSSRSAGRPTNFSPNVRGAFTGFRVSRTE